MTLFERIERAIAQNPTDPYPTGEIQELLSDCRAEIERLRLQIVAGNQLVLDAAHYAAYPAFNVDAAAQVTGQSFADIKKDIKS